MIKHLTSIVEIFGVLLVAFGLALLLSVPWLFITIGVYLVVVSVLNGSGG